MRTATLLALAVISPALSALEGPWQSNRFAETYRKMTLDELRTEMAQEVPTRRGFVAEALAEHGVEAWPVLSGALRDGDWRARACSLTALTVLFPKQNDAETQAAKSALIAGMPGVVEAVTRVLEDSHFWVRCLATQVVAGMGDPAAGAGRVLVRLCGDEHPWVREGATAALQAVRTAPDDLRLRGALNTLNSRRTSFGDSRAPFAFLKGQKLQDSEAKQETIDALLHFLTYPGEGMWSNMLTTALTMLVELDPDRERLTPLFEKILTDPSYEQRGEPRVAVCRAIREMDDDATALRPALCKAIAREKELIAKGKFSRNNSILSVLEETLQCLEDGRSPVEQGAP